MTSELLTADQMAKRISLTSRTVLAWAKQGRIPVVRISARVVRFDPAEVVQALKDANGQSKEPPQPEADPLLLDLWRLPETTGFYSWPNRVRERALRQIAWGFRDRTNGPHDPEIGNLIGMTIDEVQSMCECYRLDRKELTYILVALGSLGLCLKEAAVYRLPSREQVLKTKSLKKREKEILLAYATNDRPTYKELGGRYQISTERARAIVEKAFAKINPCSHL